MSSTSGRNRRVPRWRASRRVRTLALGAVAIGASAGLLAACGEDFDTDQAAVDVQETYGLFTAAVLAGDGPVACVLMTPSLKDELFTVGPDMVVPMGGSCEARMGQQGMAIRDENGGKDPTVALEGVEVSPVAEDGSQPFAPGGIEAWADAESVVGGTAEDIRFFLIEGDWLIGNLPPTFLPGPVLTGSVPEAAGESQ